MLKNETKNQPLFQNSLRSWRAEYLARQQAPEAESAGSEEQPEITQQTAETGTKRVKRLAPRRRKKFQSMQAGR